MKYLFIGVIISIPSYFMSNYFIQGPLPYNHGSYNSLINAMLTWVSIGLFGLLEVIEKKKTSLSSYFGGGILLSGLVFFISNIQLGGVEKNFTIILLCFIITPIFGLMELVLKNNKEDH